MDPVTLAAAAVTTLSPYLPALLSAGQSAGQTVAGAVPGFVIGKGLEAGWDRAAALWRYLTERFRDDQRLQVTAQLAAEHPADEDVRAVLARVLGGVLAERPDAAGEVARLLGGEAGVQEILAGGRSQIRDARQSQSRPATQRIVADDHSTIEGVVQES